MDNETSRALKILVDLKSENEANRPQLELHVDDSVYERLWTGQRIRLTTKERWALEAASARLTNELLAPYRARRASLEARRERRRAARRAKSALYRKKGEALRSSRGGLTERQMNRLGITIQDVYESRIDQFKGEC